MKMKKRILECLFLIICILLMGCGKNDEAEISYKEDKEIADMDEADKKVITIAIGYVSEELEQNINSFNTSNVQYEIQVQEFEDDARLQADIIAGRGSDLIKSDLIHIEEYASKGLLADLYPYLDMSENISRADIVENVLKLNTLNDQLLSLPPAFAISTIGGKRSELGDDIGWTFDEFMEYVNSHYGAEIFGGRTVGDSGIIVVEMNWQAQPEKYVNWENSKASFDSEEFLSILNFANQYESKHENDKSPTSQRLKEGNILLLNKYIYNVYDYLFYNCMAGEELTFIGYPTSDGSPEYGLYNNEGFVVNQNSQGKEGAWAFIEYLFLHPNSYARQSDFFPSNKAFLDEMLQEAMEKNYRYDADGKEVEYRKTSKGDAPSVSVDIYAATQKDIDSIRYLIDHATFIERGYSIVDAILYEEVMQMLDGHHSPETTAKNIQNRVQLYLNE